MRIETKKLPADFLQKSGWNAIETELWSDKIQEGGELELFPNPTGYDYNEVDLLQWCFEA